MKNQIYKGMKSMKQVVLDGFCLNPGDLSWEGLERFGQLTVYDRTSLDEVAGRIADADIVYTNKTPITREAMEKCKNLKFISVLATGYNIVDIRSAREMGILVANIPTYGTSSVSQMVFALLLEISQHAGAHSQAVKSGAWAESSDWCFWNYPLFELAGKTMGIIGLGRIGYSTARIAKAFGMDVIAYDEYINPSLEKEIKYVTLDELLQKSDVISLHCPLFESTREIIRKDNISKMKDGVIIINTSRGPLINEEDLLEALNTGKVAWAALDVMAKEPPEKENKLLMHERVIATPHIAWAPIESRKRLMDLTEQNLTAFLSGMPINIVNKQL